MPVPSIGDILMLSQVAWKIGRAFSACRKDAPADFQHVETDVGGLAKALTLLAEAMHAEAEHNILQNASTETQDGIASILDSCQRTVNDLDSLMDQYQVIKKHRTVGGFAIERAWSDLVLAEYKTMVWTPEGGNLRELRELLQMHTSSMTVLMQALQSKSLSRLESVVTPMTERYESMMHSNGSLEEQLDEMHRIVQGLTLTTSDSQAPPVPTRNPARSPTAEYPDPLSPRLTPRARITPPYRVQTDTTSPYQPPRRSKSPELTSSAGSSASKAAPPSPVDTGSISRASSPTQKRVSEFSFGGSSLRHSSSSYASSDAGTSSAGWQSPSPLLNDTFVSRQVSTSTKMTSPLPGTPEVREPGERADNRRLSLLPPPAIGITTSNASHVRLSPYPSTQPDLMKLHRSSTTASQKEAFEKEAFRNAATLCDVRGNLVEYSHRINEDDPKDVEMIQASGECRIAVVRKRVTDPETRTVRVVTSVWAFSDDNSTRVELRMDDDQMYIPYSSYFSPNKVSITVLCELKFHDIKHGNRPARIAKTSWVNYVFNTPQAAALFQNELMGRTLLATFRTEKTMRTHHGLSKSFSYAEQMCGLENLRIWEDNDSGAIIAMIHFSATFRDGYLAFYLNSAGDPIKVKEDGHREVKIKGLKVPVERPGRKDSAVEGKGKGRVEGKGKYEDRVISGAKIEFASEAEKRDFLDMCKEVQRNLLDLPGLLGVN